MIKSSMPNNKDRLEKYIKVKEVPNPGKKTKKLLVFNLKSGEQLGEISWYGGWRKYVYHSKAAYFDSDFLKKIGDILELLTQQQYSK